MNFVQPIRDLEKISEVREFLASKNKRDELLFCFGIYTGLRISDILTIRVKDVYGKDHFYIVEQKTKKAKQRRKKYTVRKRVPIVKKLQRLLNDFCATLQPNDFLFKSRQGKNKPITRVRAYDILREAAHHCDLKEIGTHTLRKTFGFLVYQNEKDVALLQDIFNHSAPYITLKYIGVNQDAIENAYNALNNLRI
ncbi:tyrosine-type recombinase/integrase [Lysinibacillus sp. KU-BSD001]|uniref:tyrosine-type recombinase/integrase n=1 Tax=Lysinibacillus sp. KU-BSD001 TaxID=3141328 RepID=UPI0036E66331